MHFIEINFRAIGQRSGSDRAAIGQQDPESYIILARLPGAAAGRHLVQRPDPTRPDPTGHKKGRPEGRPKFERKVARLRASVFSFSGIAAGGMFRVPFLRYVACFILTGNVPRNRALFTRARF